MYIYAHTTVISRVGHMIVDSQISADSFGNLGCQNHQTKITTKYITYIHIHTYKRVRSVVYKNMQSYIHGSLCLLNDISICQTLT